jgi:hypothetical protein
MTRKLGDVLLSVFSLVTRGGAQSIGRNGGRRMKGKVAAFSFMSGVAVALALLCSSGTVLGSQGYLTTFNNNYGNTRNPLGTVYNCGVCHTTSGASSSARNPFGTAWASTGARAIPINTALGNLDTDGDGATNAAELSAGTYPLVPMVAISAPPAGTVSGTVTVTASASDNTGRSTVAGVRFTLDGVNLGAEDTASPYSISWNTTTASNGTHTLRAVARDALGNTATSVAVTVNVSNTDATPPTVTINQAGNQTDPTSSSPINFTVVFSEAVTGFAAVDVTISGTAGGAKTVTISGTGPTYTVAVSGMTTSGTVIASIGAGVVQDGAGNPNTASTSTDNSVIYNAPDTTSPTVTINQAAAQTDPTSSSPINFTVVFSETVTGFAAVDVTISGTAGGAKTVTISGTGPTYTVAVSGMTTSGTVIASIGAGVVQDAAANLNTASTSTDNTVTFTLQPTVTFQDVPETHFAFNHIEAIYAAGITGGCQADVQGTPENEALFCPDLIVDRGQMSAFIIRALDGGNPVGGCNQVPFSDVPTNHIFCAHIEQMALRGITLGIGGGLFGPNLPLRREQMAAFLIRAVLPGDPQGVCVEPPFPDVPVDSSFCRHIEELVARQITLGCIGDDPVTAGNEARFCPVELVTRAQMAVFLGRAFLGNP